MSDPQANVTRDLDVMGSAEEYYRWIFTEIEPSLGSRVLEVGSGRGTLTRLLLAADFDKVIATDFDEAFLPGLEEVCRPHPNAEVMQLDLERPAPATLERIQAARIDSVVMINVLEHISDDVRCLEALAWTLPEGGRIVVFCPAFQWLFAPLDESYGHYRRYSKRDMITLGHRARLEIGEMHYVNLPGFFAWLLLYKVLRGRNLGTRSVSLFNSMVPVVRRLEARVRPPFGSSILAVFSKTSPHPARK